MPSYEIYIQNLMPFDEQVLRQIHVRFMREISGSVLYARNA